MPLHVNFKAIVPIGFSAVNPFMGSSQSTFTLIGMLPLPCDTGTSARGRNGAVADLLFTSLGMSKCHEDVNADVVHLLTTDTRQT